MVATTMPEPRIVRNVFLDTQAFEAECFDPSSSKLKALANLVESGVLILFSTKITIEEIEGRIRKNIAEIKNAAREAVRGGRAHAMRVAARADERFHCLLESPDVEALADLVWKKLRAYLDIGLAYRSWRSMTLSLPRSRNGRCVDSNQRRRFNDFYRSTARFTTCSELHVII